jgi:hypothetical protein
VIHGNHSALMIVGSFDLTGRSGPDRTKSLPIDVRTSGRVPGFDRGPDGRPLADEIRENVKRGIMGKYHARIDRLALPFGWLGFAVDSRSPDRMAVLCQVSSYPYSVTAVRILDKNAADCPQLVPLVKGTRCDFTIGEVAAEKAYLSVEACEEIAGMGRDGVHRLQEQPCGRGWREH